MSSAADITFTRNRLRGTRIEVSVPLKSKLGVPRTTIDPNRYPLTVV